ncbi:MAG: phospholipase D family protein [Rhodospirillaceae bacterium]
MMKMLAVALTITIAAPCARAADIAAICFTPGGDCTDIIVHEIDSAHRQVLVQAYSFTSAPIADALVKAKKRGVDVQAVLDRSQRTERYTGATFLANGGVPVLIDSAHAIAHNKVMVIDGATVITGSFNFTKAAQEHNAENLLVIRDAGVASMYANNWREHAEHSEPYR